MQKQPNIQMSYIFPDFTRDLLFDQSWRKREQVPLSAVQEVHQSLARCPKMPFVFRNPSLYTLFYLCIKVTVGHDTVAWFVHFLSKSPWMQFCWNAESSFQKVFFEGHTRDRPSFLSIVWGCCAGKKTAVECWSWRPLEDNKAPNYSQNCPHNNSSIDNYIFTSLYHIF